MTHRNARVPPVTRSEFEPIPKTGETRISPVGLAVDGANGHDMRLVRATVDSFRVPRPTPSPEHPQGLCLDKGYDFLYEVRRTVDEFGFRRIWSAGTSLPPTTSPCFISPARLSLSEPPGY